MFRLTGYSPQHLNSVVRLQDMLWGAGEACNVRYLNWKYVQNPYLDSRYIVLGWAGSELAGMLGAFGTRWQIGEDQVVLPCVGDTVIVPEHRGTSLFVKMLDRLIERLAVSRIPLLLDFGDQPAGPAMLMRGWKSIGPWPILT